LTTEEHYYQGAVFATLKAFSAVSNLDSLVPLISTG